MLKVTSFNANGIRSAAKKGFFDWLEQEKIDVLCVLETKAQEHQLDDPIFHPPGYHRYFFDAHKKGYSGVAIYTRYEPDNITTGLGWEIADTEGRYIQIDFDKISISSLYLPSGTNDERQSYKYEFLDAYLPILQKQKNSKSRKHIICGDWNIANNNIDIKNWKANQKSSGFLPEEREWLDNLLNNVGMVDAFRYLHPDKVQYTWWSHRAKAWDNNVGWRIDYHIISPGLRDDIQSASVYREQKFSDHAPLTVCYNIEI